MDRDAAFDKWLHNISPESLEDGAFIPAAWQAWLRELFDREGPLPRQEVEGLAVRDLKNVAELSLAVVLGDVEAATGKRLVMEIVDDEGLRVRYVENEYIAHEAPEGLSTIDRSGMLVAIAESVLDVLQRATAEDLPRCADHEDALAPRMERNRPYWWCSRGGHSVAEIGELPG